MVLKTHNARGLPGKLPGRRSLTLKAEVKFVNAEQAKELISVDGYSVLDVRDITQFERAHIKSCYHVPLFVENKDNDPGIYIYGVSSSKRISVHFFISFLMFFSSPHSFTFCRYNHKKDSAQ